MKALGLLGVLIVLVAAGALIAYWVSYMAARRDARKAAATPWQPWDGERDGTWVVEARRPGHKAILLASQPIEDGFLSVAVTQARADAYENFMALTPRGRWNL